MRTSERGKLTDKDDDAMTAVHDLACKSFLTAPAAMLFTASAARPAIDIDPKAEEYLLRLSASRETYHQHVMDQAPLVELEHPIYAERLSLPVCWADVMISPAKGKEGKPLIVEVKTSLQPTRLNPAPIGTTLRQLRLLHELTKLPVALAIYDADAEESEDDLDVFEHHGFAVVRIERQVRAYTLRHPKRLDCYPESPKW